MKRAILIIISISCLYNFTKSQTFTTTPYITIPGSNSDIDVLTDFSYYGYPTKSFICWVNEIDSVYRLYLRQTTPDTKNDILIYTDNNIIANPKIAFSSTTNFVKVRIIWQSFISNHWQILSRIYSADSLTGIMAVTDSLTDCITPFLSEPIIGWIQDGNLVYHYLDSTGTGNYVLDSLNCSNPYITKFSYAREITYEKGSTGNKQIFKTAYQNYYPGSKWQITQISNGGNNAHPREFSQFSMPVYESFVNGYWNSVFNFFWIDTIGSITFNCKNPIAYTYPMILSKTSIYTTPCLLVYDSDSLTNNKEIILKTGYPYHYTDSAINLSNAEGDDYLPNISFFSLRDSPYVGIYWTHDQNGKKDIWMAYAKYFEPHGAVTEPGMINNLFTLNQNYPNPFNPSTIISWHLIKGSAVTLKIFDILGNEICTLVNDYLDAGEHSISFNPKNIPGHKISSGIYFYQLEAGANISTKKMLF